MSYRLGVDLGTAYSSAAVGSQGKARMVALGNRSAVLPSVVFVREGGGVLVGVRPTEGVWPNQPGWPGSSSGALAILFRSIWVVPSCGPSS